jgi:mono/diheme cytochrome c family protein
MRPVLKLLRRVVLVLLSVILLAALLGTAYFYLRFPRTAAPLDVQAPRTAERLARGAYLSQHVAGCTDCHGERDWTKYSAPQMREHDGRGGMVFNLDVGKVVAPNISPAKLSTWTDGEVLRAMTEGVSKDGSALFPMMPYENFRLMAREDAEAIIAFIRTLPHSDNTPPPTALNFPLNFIVRTMPQPATLPATAPDPADKVTYGRYLTTIASCVDCHTMRGERGQPKPGMAYAGGMEFKTRSGGTQRSANITPDVETGIGGWSEATFIERFKSIAELPESALALNGRQNTEMPWRDYGGMTREDLGAIYTYLRTITPVRHAVAR